MAGHTLLRGYPDRDASETTLDFVSDAVAGIYIAFATIAALHYRRRTGKGQFVDIGMVEGVASLLPQALMDYFVNKRVQKTLGNRDPYMAPQGAYPCRGKDRWIAISIYKEEQWIALCALMGNQELAKDPKFNSREKRLQHHDELDEIIERWTSQQELFELFHRLQNDGIPAGPIMNEADAYADPQLKNRGFFEKVTQADCGTHFYPGMLWNMSETQGFIRQPPCLLGEHNEYVYRQVLGVSDDEYAELEAEGHIGTEYAADV
jgi:benzylsuccinate CoA-transferase BbsF subunit